MDDRDRFERVDALFRSAYRLDASERDAFLTAECGADDALRAEVEALLRQDDATQGPLDAAAAVPTSWLADARAAVASDDPDTGPRPERIADYTIVGALGRGGMGVVYDAEQDTPRRRVALKVINPGIVTDTVLRRFRFETEALGRLQHPGIAQIYAAGTFDDGAGAQPYFAMERIEGVPLTRFAESRKLRMTERLELLARLCDAVAHAHQRGVIHRDLKPANILVTDDGQPKILDFGVGCATDRDLQATYPNTQVGEIVGTVAYMSPEQAEGDRARLDTRSDIYALGVIGYELLAGRPPHDVRDKLLHEALRAVREDEPTPLTSHSRLFAGDVATIIDTALAKDRSRRYATAAAMAADLRRFLADEPILARPPSVIYQLGKFAKRNRGLVATGTVFVAALLVLATGTTVAAFREHDLRTEAETQARVAEAVSSFLRFDLLGRADPSERARADLTILEVLDRAAGEIDDRFLDDPDVHVAIRETMVQAYLALGRADAALLQLEGAERMADRVDAEMSGALLASRARIELELGRYDAAVASFDAALDFSRAHHGPDDAATLALEQDRAVLLDRMGRSDEAIETFERVRERLAAGGAAERNVFVLENQLAIAYENAGDGQAAHDLYRSVLERRRAALGDDHWDTINSMIGLGNFLSNAGVDDEAEALMLEARARLAARGTAPENPRALTLENNLALLYLYTDRTAEAEPIFERTLEVGRTAEGPEHPNTLSTMHNLASLRWREKRYEDAVGLFEDTAEIRTRVLGADHPDTLLTKGMLGRTYMSLKRRDDGVRTLRETYEAMRDAPSFGPDHPFTARTREGLVTALRIVGRDDEADAYAAEAPSD